MRFALSSFRTSMSALSFDIISLTIKSLSKEVEEKETYIKTFAP